MSGVRNGIYTALAADPTLTALLSAPTAIFHQVAPQTASPPYVVISKQSGTRMQAFAGQALRPALWLVKAIDRSTTADTAEAIDARAEAILTDAALVIDDQALLYLRRDSDVEYPETSGGEQWHHVGGLYRLVTDPA